MSFDDDLNFEPEDLYLNDDDDSDIIDLLTPEQLQCLDESIKQLEEGDFILHEEVLRRSREWHKEKR